MRLIDADALYERISNGDNDADWYYEDLVEKSPTIDPLRHGHWKEIDYFNGCTPDYDCVCSICEASGAPYYPFCPNCGAKMDEPVFTDDEEPTT